MAPSGRADERRREAAKMRKGVQFDSTYLGPSGSGNPPRFQGASPGRPAMRRPTSTVPQQNTEDVDMDDIPSDGEQVYSNDEQDHLDAQLAAPEEYKLGKETFLLETTVAARGRKPMFAGKGPETPGAGYENNGKDEALLNGIERLKSDLVTFAQQIPPVSDKSGYLDRILAHEKDELIRYIGCLCLGGRRRDWNTLLTDNEAREAIVLGVISRALKEHVFGDYLFGADEAFKQELRTIDVSSQQHDGFERTQKRAAAIGEYRAEAGAFEHSLLRVTHQIIKLLTPLWIGADKSNKSAQEMSGAHKKHLREIIHDAAGLANLIRAAPDVTYYWPPTFKDEEFDPSRMEVLNLAQMIQNSPYDKVPSGKGERAVLRDPKKVENVQAIVRIVAFPGIVAYRQYGGDLAHNEIIDGKIASSRLPRDVRESYGGPKTAENGFRSRLISKSVVYLQWGQQRLLTKEAGTSAHLDAVREGKMEKYEEDSAQVVELHALWQAKHPRVSAGGRK